MCSTGNGDSRGVRSGDEDPPCIVGMACRLPGSIKSPAGLWEFMMRKGCGQGPVPAKRFHADGFYDADSSRAGVMDVGGGYFVDEDVRAFDNAFFGIHNLEAASMDPQQRKLLEIVFECLEHAGVPLDRISGSNTGVFVGNFTLDHQTMQSRDIDAIHRFSATGCGTTILANRVSHVFNLQGPSVTLDTACSSSLYALHSAVSAMNAGDCDGAVVAAVNLIMSPEQSLAAAKSGVLSPTSTCHTFDVAADGYGRAEGINAIYLKPLSSAIRDRDKIWAVVRGTAVNANGKTPGMTQPSAALQEAVIRRAYTKAGLSFVDSDYIECHGTGTPVGDPIEVDALGRCFGRTEGATPLLIGSSKPGLGHSEAASGLTALIKVALALEHGKIPPTYGVANINPALKLDAFNMKIASEIEEWPRERRRASINAFGYGGANAHAILESAHGYMAFERPHKTPDRTPAHQSHDGILLLPVTAASPKSLDARVAQIRTVVEEARDTNPIASLSFVLGERISHFTHRALLFATTHREPDAKPGLLDITLDMEVGRGRGDSPPPLAFVFTGQGAQYAAMGRELLAHNACFRASIRHLDRSLQSHLPPELAPDWTLEDALSDPTEPSSIHRPGRSQPACTAVQMGLVDLLRSWHIQPCAVVGHSSGEIAAAYAAGLVSGPQAIVTAYLRGYAVEQRPRKGAMLAAGVPADVARTLVRDAGRDHEVSVACVNSPESVTLSGPEDGIEHLMAEMRQAGRFTRKLRTGGRAYHSSMMVAAGHLYERLLATPWCLQAGQETGPADRLPGTDMYSSTGAGLDGKALILDREAVTASYWRQNLEQPVQFDRALSTLLGANRRVHLVEIGPHPSLKGPVEQVRSHLGYGADLVPYSCTLVRGRSAELCMKQLAGTFFLRRHTLRWTGVNGLGADPPPSALESLPYPWDYSAGLLWQEPRASVETRNRRFPRHELLGSQQPSMDGFHLFWRNMLSLKEVPWLRDHQLETQIVFPGSCYLAMALEALSQRSDTPSHSSSRGTMAGFEFRHVSIKAALVIPDGQVGDEGVELHTVLSPRGLSSTTVSQVWHDFSISSMVAGRATRHCSGRIRTLMHGEDSAALSGAVTVAKEHRLEEWQNMSPWYARFAREGLRFGPAFQSVRRLRTDSSRSRFEATGTTDLVPVFSRGVRGTRYPVHPVTLDACIQVAIMGSAAGDISDTHVYLPVFIDQCRIATMPGAGNTNAGSQAAGSIQATSAPSGPLTRCIASSLWSTTDSPAPLLYLQGARVTKYHSVIAEQRQNAVSRQPCLRVHWKPDIRHLSTDTAPSLDSYVMRHASNVQKVKEPELDCDIEQLTAVGALLDLAGHQNPGLRILELRDNGSDDARRDVVRDALDEKRGYFRRYRSWQSLEVDQFADDPPLLDSKDGMCPDYDGGPFDVVFVDALKDFPAAAKVLEPLLHERSVLITRNSHGKAAVAETLRSGMFEAIELPMSRLTLASRQFNHHVRGIATDAREVLIVTPDSCSVAMMQFARDLESRLTADVALANTKIVPLAEIEHVKGLERMIMISMLELETGLLASMSQRNLDCLRNITNGTTSLLWLSGAGILGNNPNPDLCLSRGLARALMLEQPSLSFVHLDIGPIADREDATFHNVSRVLNICFGHDEKGSGVTVDKEFAQKDGLLYISRFGPDFDLNSLFRRRFEKEQGAIQTIGLSDMGPAKLVVDHTLDGGRGDTLYFEQVREPRVHAGRNTATEMPPDGYIDVDVKALSLNAKDVYVLKGRVETRGATTALEFSGVVTAVGPDLLHLDGQHDADAEARLRPGDRVVVGMPCQFATSLRVPAWAAQKTRPGEQPAVVATLPTIYGTALYALTDRARLRPGESVLIHGGAGAFGFAAITVAKRILGLVGGGGSGSRLATGSIYATAGSPARRRFITSRLGIPESQVFGSRDTSFAEQVKKATSGRGVDVVVNYLAGDLLQAGWECVAPFGRFVEIGKRDLADAGRLDMHVFLRNATFTAFDFSDLYYQQLDHHDPKFAILLKEVFDLYRSGQIEAPPVTTFPAAEIAEAYRYFSNEDRLGKVVVSFEHEDEKVPSLPPRYMTLLHPQKAYLLVGCLGGLGRSLARWMVGRGARNLVFLGRSGCDKPSARDLVSDLETSGVRVRVVRGDVVHRPDVDAAVAACLNGGSVQLGGVVQAAMGLREGLFSGMSAADWHTAVAPKWRGTWNLHAALEAQRGVRGGTDGGGGDDPLDFFLMTSSLSGSVGTATETNYCAANSFLDAFAHWRRSRGRPAVSVGLGMISEVGYLHENPEIEALLLRKGIHPLSEAEFLQVIDLALAAGADRNLVESQGQGHPATSAHILTGLEPTGFRQLASQGFDVKFSTAEDPRLSILAAAVEREQDAERSSLNTGAGEGAMGVAHDNSAAAPWFHGLPTHAKGLLGPEAGASSLQAALLTVIRRRFASLILTPLSRLDDAKSVAQFGVDSMIASELRAWLWTGLRVDVPFLDILRPETNLVRLAELAEMGLTGPN